MHISKRAGAPGALATQPCSSGERSASHRPCPSSPPGTRNMKIKTTDEHQSPAETQDWQKRYNLPPPCPSAPSINNSHRHSQVLPGQGRRQHHPPQAQGARSEPQPAACLPGFFCCVSAKSDWKAAGSLVHRETALRTKPGLYFNSLCPLARLLCLRHLGQAWGKSRCCRCCAGTTGSTAGLQSTLSIQPRCLWSRQGIKS